MTDEYEKNDDAAGEEMDPDWDEDSIMTVYRPNDEELEIYSVMQDGTILIARYSKKPWGVCNITGWYLAADGNIPSDDMEAIASGDGTDWEYVFRVAGSADIAAEFSGGNHGRESLESLEMFDDNGEVLDLELYESVKVKSLKIIENTFLALDGNCEEKYAEVERTYRFMPSKIILETRFVFTEDVYMGTSYVCMFPVSKTFGNHIRFDESGNTYETPQYGHTLTAGGYENFIGIEKTLSVRIWGDRIPGCRFRVWIDNEDMADGFRNELKVFFWDLNQYVNKLYFSKYANDIYTRVPSGTVWKNKAGWEVLCGLQE